MIKKTILALIIPLLFYSQNKETINWIMYNSITIEDANPDSELMILKTYLINLIIPKFMGLGSIPQHKEFFNLKAKFFKHLVKSRCENFYNGRILSRIWHK
jgi:hypothetical protein